MGLMVKQKAGRPRAKDRQDDGLVQAIAAAGSVTALAEGLGLTVQAVSQWKRVPPTQCPDVERLTGVPRDVLRPDIYGTPLIKMKRVRVRPSRLRRESVAA